MQEYKQLTQVQFKGKNLLLSSIASFILFFFPPLAGAFYVAGSFVYWPTFTNINPATGGILFTIGSVLLVLTDFAGTYLEPDFSMFKPLKNVGAFRAFCSFIGNASYTVGSVYFLPSLPVIVGEDLFILGSIFQFIPQILSIWGVCSLNLFTAPFYIKMVSFKKSIIFMNLFTAAGCFFFFVGTFLFMDQSIESNDLFKEAVMLFIIGSACFVVGPLFVLRMRKIRVLDPMVKYHDEVNSLFLPKKAPIQFDFVKSQTINKKNFLILSKQRSFIRNSLQHQTY